MAELDVLDQNSKKVGTVTLPEAVFEAKVRDQLVQRYVVMQQAASRSGTAKVKNSRSEVRGGGRKPWKQKGTGRARQGSIRAAQWRGGNVVFGPQPRDYSFTLTKKSKRLALKSVFTDCARNNGLLVVQDLNLAEPKTKEALKLLKGLNLTGNTLFLLAEDNPNLRLAVRNLPRVDVLPVDGVNVFDLLNHDRIVVTPESLKKIEERLN